MRYSPETVLVTGAAGFIGANFSRYMAAAHVGRLVLLDALTYAGNLESISDLLESPNVRFVHGDICDGPLLQRLFEEENIDTVVHFAAESHVDRSIHGPDEFVRTNVVGTHELLKAARSAWASLGGVGARFHHVSTDEVYGSVAADSPPTPETAPFAPNSPYAASKAAADHLVRAYNRTYDLPTVTTNCSNNYGPYQFPEKLIPLAIVRALAGQPIPVYGDGLQIRDWLHVDDHCRALDAVLRRGRDGETYNIGGTSDLANRELLRRLCAIIDELFENAEIAARFPDAPAACGRRTEELLQSVPDRPGHDRRYALDASKLQRELGVAAAVSIDDGLRRTVQWYVDNEPWWRRVMDGSYREWMAAHYGVGA